MENGGLIMLRYSIGNFITWCGENYKVLDNYNDFSGTVMDMSGNIINNFYFEYLGEIAEVITDKDKIIEIEKHLIKQKECSL